jgi:hypothetical protein
VKNITPNKEIQKYSDFGGFQFSELRGKKSPDFLHLVKYRRMIKDFKLHI